MNQIRFKMAELFSKSPIDWIKPVAD